MSDLTREEMEKEIIRLKEEHAALDARVIAFEEQPWLSTEDQIALKECKKLKLKAKERMVALQDKLAAM